jgi:hypothetical protein
MKTAELKLELFNTIDKLPKPKLEKLFGMVTNFLNNENDLNEWSKLSEIHQKELLTAIDDIEEGNFIDHKTLMKKYRTQYSNA